MMSVSQRFYFNYFDVTTDNKEAHKFEMTNEYLHRMLSVSGAHQRSISLSRCYRLTSPAAYQSLSLCTNVWFVDLSYSTCENIAPLVTCTVLRSLVLSGLRIADYTPLQRMISLELLSMSFSDVVSIEPLSELRRLRSLNLEHTCVVDISPIKMCTRLEELLLDSSKVCEVSSALQVFSKLPHLRYRLLFYFLLFLSFLYHMLIYMHMYIYIICTDTG